jgi:tripartite-type tricarboxylate transporter receptor subunit TctC
MELPRRRFLHLAAGVATLPAASPMAWAQAYPTRPVRIIVGAAPGGVDDLAVRLIGQSLSERLGQPFVVDNQPISMATQEIASALPDGHTLIFVTAANIIRAIQDAKLNFDFSRDVAPVAGTSRNPFVMAVNPSIPAKTVTEFVAYANSNPGKLKMASVGKGSIPHLVGELFNMMAAVKTVSVPYDGLAPMESAVLSGQAQFMFDALPPSIKYIKAGTLRALAVTSATGLSYCPMSPP